MKNIKKIAVLLLLVSIIGCAFSGCTPKSNPTSIAIAMGKRKNTAEPAFASSKLNQDILTAATTDGSHISIVETDGNGFIVASVPINIKAGSSKAIQTKDANALIGALGSIIAETIPKTPEADILKGISLAVRELATNDKATKRILYILDGGLHTKGSLINMSELNIIDGYTDSVVKKAAAQLPNMSDIDEVFWIGLGDFVDDQPDADEDTREKLKAFWGGVLAAAGAKDVEFLPDNTQKVDNPDDWPKVSTVNFVRESITDEELNLNGIMLSEEKVSFLPNTAEFVNKNEALKSVSVIANALKTDPAKNVFIVGSTASFGSKEGCKTLSQSRAEAVKALFVSCGVVEERLIAFGIGQEVAGFKVNDIDEETGELIESCAIKNRAVFIFENSSENKDIQELYRRFA